MCSCARRAGRSPQIGTALSDNSETNKCRSSLGVQASASMPGARRMAGAEVAADVGGVGERRADPSGEDQAHLDPLPARLQTHPVLCLPDAPPARRRSGPAGRVSVETAVAWCPRSPTGSATAMVRAGGSRDAGCAVLEQVAAEDVAHHRTRKLTCRGLGPGDRARSLEPVVSQS